MVKKVIDSRIHTLVKNGVQNKHRSFFVIVGDKGKDQVCRPPWRSVVTFEEQPNMSLTFCFAGLRSLISIGFCHKLKLRLDPQCYGATRRSLDSQRKCRASKRFAQPNRQLTVDYFSAIAKRERQRLKRILREVSERPTQKIPLNSLLLWPTFDTPTIRRRKRSSVTLMACVSFRTLKPSLPTHLQEPSRLLKVEVWLFCC